jgi:hypothetical protein
LVSDSFSLIGMARMEGMVVIDEVVDMAEQFTIARFPLGVGCGRGKSGSIPCESI